LGGVVCVGVGVSGVSGFLGGGVCGGGVYVIEDKLCVSVFSTTFETFLIL